MLRFAIASLLLLIPSITNAQYFLPEYQRPTFVSGCPGGVCPPSVYNSQPVVTSYQPSQVVTSQYITSVPNQVVYSSSPSQIIQSYPSSQPSYTSYSVSSPVITSYQPSQVVIRQQPSLQRITSYSSSCPGGVCPTPSRTRWFRR